MMKIKILILMLTLHYCLNGSEADMQKFKETIEFLEKNPQSRESLSKLESFYTQNNEIISSNAAIWLGHIHLEGMCGISDDLTNAKRFFSYSSKHGDELCTIQGKLMLAWINLYFDEHIDKSTSLIQEIEQLALTKDHQIAFAHVKAKYYKSQKSDNAISLYQEIIKQYKDIFMLNIAKLELAILLYDQPNASEANIDTAFDLLEEVYYVESKEFPERTAILNLLAAFHISQIYSLSPANRYIALDFSTEVIQKYQWLKSKKSIYAQMLYAKEAEKLSQRYISSFV